jgi:hypothetical protein
LAQQASGHIVTSGLFSTKDQPTLSNADIHGDRSASGRIGEHVGMIDGRETNQEGSGDGSVEGGQGETGGDRNITWQNGEMVLSRRKDENVDWRAPLVKYMRNPRDAVDRKIRR